jgi:hypothetical protein
MEPHQVYYQLMMGTIGAVKIGSAWRMAPEAVRDYDKRFPKRKNRKTSSDSIYTGSSELFFCAPQDCSSSDTQGTVTGVERRRGQLVCSAERSDKILLQKHKSILQLELFSA